jgi:hypothetical protein
VIENSYVTVASDGKRVTVEYLEDGERREGPATFPARYSSFAAICQYIHTQFNTRRLETSQLAQIQGLLGSPWPARVLRFNWRDLPETRP